MASTTRLFKSLLKLLLPVMLIVIVAIAAGSIWLVYTAARPVSTRYLVTPDKYGQLSSRAAQVTEETWPNLNGTTSRGWLLRGAENAPAVILLHRFGADRSHVLNLGVKLNESTNFTVLMPDLRGHGASPLVEHSSFGGCEAEDLTGALEFVKGLKTPTQMKLINDKIGVFGVEMGAMIAVKAASRDQSIRALALDSVPGDSDGLLEKSIDRRFPFASFATSKLAKLGTRLYYFDGCYQRDPVCDIARKIEDRSVLLLAGLDAPDFQDPTSRLSKCFPATNRVLDKLDLSPSGFSIINASMEQSATYDQRLIDFFRENLGN
jgi:pimeloyl-ACP methyl ester carboxylesterase